MHLQQLALPTSQLVNSQLEKRPYLQCLLQIKPMII
jgi:hypothetical protein